jgi:hypothetical protein
MATNKRDLKAYSRFDGTGRIVPGSTVLRRNKPKVGKWKETQAYECCDGGECPQRVYDPFVTFQPLAIELFGTEFNLVQMIWACENILPGIEVSNGGFRILENPIAPSTFTFSNWDDVINFLNTNFSEIGVFSYLGGINVQVITTPSINEYIQCSNAQFLLEFFTP